MAEIPWPLSNTPGLRPQDGAGRLVNVYAEPRGEGLGPVWRRVPGAVNFIEIYPSVLAQSGSMSVLFVGASSS